MKISKKTLYAAWAILDLALHTGQGLVRLKDIAARQDLSEAFLEQLMIPLRRAGLIISVRGAKGGHRLAKHPSEITLADVVKAVEGSVSLMECAEDPSKCSRSSACALRAVWKEAIDDYSDRLSSINFQKIAEEQIQLVTQDKTMYYI